MQQQAGATATAPRVEDPGRGREVPEGFDEGADLVGLQTVDLRPDAPLPAVAVRIVQDAAIEVIDREVVMVEAVGMPEIKVERIRPLRVVIGERLLLERVSCQAGAEHVHGATSAIRYSPITNKRFMMWPDKTVRNSPSLPVRDATSQQNRCAR
ncbi:hypothetical protein [Streptomyces abikoensis]|uniref:hypothetical protein n=1 Tax=Streptomyces abikoensis TaxID=97398 RepID=UPI0033E9914B